MPSFAENLKSLPETDHIERIEIYDKYGDLVREIPNVEGKKGTVRVLNYLAGIYDNRLDKVTALKGVDLYAEIAQEAVQTPGLHPNTDLLLFLANDNSKNSYEIRVIDKQ